MTCPHCQTWNVDGDHRCRRCGRRTKASYGGGSAVYSIGATATAPDFEAVQFDREQPQVSSDSRALAPSPEAAQQTLFSVGGSRVIAFESLTPPATRDAIRERASELNRPAPLKTERVQVSPRKARESSGKTKKASAQQKFDFFGHSEASMQPRSAIGCEAPVAPPMMRFHAALIDGAVMAAGCLVAILIFRLGGGALALTKSSAVFIAVALGMLPVFYKLLWSFANRDTIGMQAAGLKLVDLDGNLPPKQRRYGRVLASLISLLAAGMGLVWVLVDADGLGWHDHMSSTFPTVA